MTLFIRTFLLGALLAFSPASSAQSPGTAFGEIVETSTGPYSVGDTYEVTVRLRAQPGDVGLGTSSLVIDFASAFASFAASPGGGTSGDYEFSRYQGLQSGEGGANVAYSSDVVRTNPDRLTANINLLDPIPGLTGPGGQALPNEFVDIVALRFTVQDPSVTPVLAFETVQLFDGEDPGNRYDIGTFSGIGGPGVDLTLDGGEGWYFLSPPVSELTALDFLGSLWTQGYTDSDAPGGDATVYTYDETATGTANDGYAPISSASTAVPSGTGLFVYVFEDDDPRTPEIDSRFPKTLSVNGTAPTLPFGFPGLSFSDTGSAPDDGWMMLGNPIQDPLDFDAAGWTKTNVADAVYVWSPVTDEYLTYSAGTGDLVGGEIPPGFGFWVQTTGAGPILEAPAAAAVSTRRSTEGDAEAGGESTEAGEESAEAEARLATAEASVLELRVTGTTVAGERGASVFAAFGVEGAALGADPMDAYALVPPSDTYLLGGLRRDDGEALAISQMPSFDEIDLILGVTGTLEIPFAVDYAGLAGETVTVRWPQVPQAEGWSMVLVDRTTGEEVDLGAAESYAFTVATGRAAAPAAASPSAPEEPSVERPGVGAPARLTTGVTVPVGLGLLSFGAAEARGDEDRFVVRFSRLQAVAAEGLPTVFAVRGPAPNPATGRLGLGVELPSASGVSATVFDLLGRRVLTLTSEDRAAGRHDLTLDVRGLASGIYVVRTTLRPVSGDARVFTHKLTVIR